MTEEQLIKRVDSLLCVAIISIAVAGTHLPYFKEPEQIEEEKEPVTPEIVLIPQVYEKRQPNKAVLKEMELRNLWQSVDVTYTTLETEYLGRYFVTAYAPYECGYNGSNYPKGWTTSSGAICHYSDDPYEPTTCAIDRNYHRYGELLMIEGKVYVTEDTGPGVRGLWVDCFVETMEEVYAWDTGYKSVYSVSYEDHELPTNERKVLHERLNTYLHDWRVSYRSPDRNDNRAFY